LQLLYYLSLWETSRNSIQHHLQVQLC